MKKPLKTSSKTAVKKTSATHSKAKVAPVVKKPSKPIPAKASKAVPPAKSKVVSKSQPVVKKASPKVVAKPVSKPAVKPAPKPAAKPAAKVIAKPSAKTLSKVTPKPPAKAPVKAAAKAAVKAAVKPAAKASVKAKPVVKPVVKTAVKPVAKSAAKPVVKQAVKAVVKPAKPVKPEKISAKQAKADKAAAAAALVVAPVSVPGSADVPARAVRPSARLAQITVPSMAQSVASTAAKASYLQNTPSEVLTPPPFVAVKKDSKLANNWKTKKPNQLTDAEIMAMSDNEYMNDSQMAFFRLKLVELKMGILANAGETTEHLREDTVVVPDPADRATIEEEHALELRTRDRERKLLKKIEQSIQRIDSGDYGYCDETGEPIGVGRLLARPTANLSLEAQQRRELKQKMFGD